MVRYFDHNATSPLLPQARAAWLEAAEAFPGNPSSQHRLGARAERVLTDARERVARLLGCLPQEIVWTSGGTESANMVLHHFASHLSPEEVVLISSVEHPCVLEAAAHHFSDRCQLIPAEPTGRIDLGWCAQRLSGADKVGLVAVMAANNETGLLQPWREVRELCRERSIPFFCDATQWIGRLPAADLGSCAFVSGCAHKFGGPRGIGFLKCPQRPGLSPLLLGGPQEEGRRAGTENVPGVLGMAAAWEYCEALLVAGGAAERAAWRDAFEQQLLVSFPAARILGAGQDRLWNTLSCILPAGKTEQRWVVRFDKHGCAVSSGSACASGREKPSHVLQAMGCTPAETTHALRFSSGWLTSEEDWKSLAGVAARLAL